MKKLVTILLVLAMVFAFAACKKGGATPSAGSDEPGKTAPKEDGGGPAPFAPITLTPLVDDGSGVILPIGNAKGPHGQDPGDVQAILDMLTPEKVEEIRNGGYTAAISIFATNLDWSTLTIMGIQEVMDQFNIELIAVGDAEWDITKQISDMESIIAMEPDLIVAFCMDQIATNEVFQKAVQKGIKLALIDSVPNDLAPPKDYAGFATADNYACSKAAAQELANYLGGEGKVAMLTWWNDVFTHNNRNRGALDIFDPAPGIEVITQSVDSVETCASTAETLLTAHPDLKGFWVCWDAGAMGVVGVLENMGKDDIKVVTIDLSTDSAYSIATGGALLATGAQHPYDQGIAESLIGVAALAGLEPPSFVVVPGEIVTQATVGAAWDRIFKTVEMPDMLKDVLGR